MTEQYKKLKETLAEIFQLDQADLDFGIYRIMNQKRDEINAFLDKKLLEDVKEALAQSTSQDTSSQREELDNLIKTLKSAGINPDENDKVNELKAQYQSAGSPEALVNEVFSHLTNFFRRYYHQGDFISQRRYKKDVYAIPYEGEEVKLYWANHDQYYIKTGENFKNYSFNLPDGLKVSFVLRDASTDQNNNKTQQGKERRFKLVEEDIFSFENEAGEMLSASQAMEAKHLKIWFTYEPEDKKVKQDDLRQAAAKTIKGLVPANFRPGLLQPKPTEKNKERTLLDKHLQDYMAKNTFDYFIHKDLGGFLNRELDFYIKNEVLEIDDINLDVPQSFERQLRIVKALKTIARKLIALMAQLEDFQKKLWLKKKLVIQSDYCITLDRVPEELYPDMLKNQAQIREWDKLFAISDIKKEKGGDMFTADTIAYTEVFDQDGKLLSGAESKGLEFLKANPFLVLDTQFFGKEWKYKLLASISDIDGQCDGLMINSENFQALRFLENKSSQQIDGIYIDPPYNTSASEILYKNSYKHSSWLSLIDSRISLSKVFLKGHGIFCLTIDDVEFNFVKTLLGQAFDENNFLGVISIRNNPSGRSTLNGVSIAHEYAIIYGNSDKAQIGRLQRNQKQLDRYSELDAKGNYEWVNFRKHGGTRTESPKMFYPILLEEDSFRIPKIEWKEKGNFWEIIESLTEDQKTRILYPIDDNGQERRWKWSLERFIANPDEFSIRNDRNGRKAIYLKARINDQGILPLTWWEDKKYSATAYGTNLLKNIFGELNSFSYPKSIHAVEDSIRVLSNGNDGKFLDYFSGSGTTGHAVINLNREDGGSRKYILVEMGEYFNTVTKPRIQKVIYSEDWKDGKPVSRKGSSHCFKYLRLESYEDTLNNLELKRSSGQQSLLGSSHFGEEYLLHYMLETESRESLLNLEQFKRPFGYTLKVTENNELKEQEVDLVETFNYLIGLVVQSMEIIRDCVVVQGHNLAGEKILVIWRDVDKTDNAALNTFFRKLDINTRDSEFKRIYVNGDNNLENIRTDDEQWKVMLIEEEFHRRMFEE
ncbi:site-specific DNA-methyltransferase [Cecembia calidifontis]|uniref:Adenine-specific DNA-methyltransferase n=1 Tax=Cecembia calidifontis TaxID=1187080 RepID=A0A4Q7PC58_9BACT|nr:site-specific DNA-methyltransferase [Cecembia calidifontis]RZS97160.1 adenine-specific DNA-methyltransferase [Cecembia calidifontis]